MPRLAERAAGPRHPSSAELRLVALPDFPLVSSGDDLAGMTAAALTRAGLQLRAGDVLVFAQKVISKAEGRLIDLATVVPGERALELSRTVQKDPRLVELVLVEHRLGLIMANAASINPTSPTPRTANSRCCSRRIRTPAPRACANSWAC